VHRLLSSGFPKGALSRCRTLHELAVTSIVIAEHGREPAHADLAEKFLLHQVVMEYKDALVYQEQCETLGYEPFSDEAMAKMKRRHDDLVQRYGPLFAKPYGWASGLDGPQPTFRDLEKLAELSHLRSHYRWASHEVHSDAVTVQVPGAGVSQLRPSADTWLGSAVATDLLARPDGGVPVNANRLACLGPPRCRRRWPGPAQGPGKVAIRPYLSDSSTVVAPAPRDCVGPGQERDSGDRHVRAFGAYRDFAGALGSNRSWFQSGSGQGVLVLLPPISSRPGQRSK
jgi:hypothetical protein